ncbi:MAG: alpha/beta hydrolase [Hyphomicrobiales bacterium]|nr:alpha/beta hydrolase [Hyphomicrobiales bacterium]
MSADGLPDLRSTTVDGLTMSWREAGQGEPLVLVHGIGGHSGAWRHQLAAFAREYRVVAWDAPGYGGSDALPPERLTADDYAASLAALLRSLGVRRPHLVGHSLGAIIIATACRRDRIDGRTMTLLQPVTGSGMLPESEREPIRLARIADMRRLGPRAFAVQRGRSILSPSTPAAVADAAIEVMKAVPETGYLAAWEMMCRSDLFSALDSRRPALIVCGADDPVCPPEIARSIGDRLPAAVYHCLDGVGHYASIEAPDRLERVLRDFLVDHRG